MNQWAEMTPQQQQQACIDFGRVYEEETKEKFQILLPNKPFDDLIVLFRDRDAAWQDGVEGIKSRTSNNKNIRATDPMLLGLTPIPGALKGIVVYYDISQGVGYIYCQGVEYFFTLHHISAIGYRSVRIGAIVWFTPKFCYTQICTFFSYFFLCRFLSVWII